MITRLITTTLILTHLACSAARAQETQDLRPGVVRIYNAAPGRDEQQGTGFIVRIRGGKAYVVSAVRPSRSRDDFAAALESARRAFIRL